MHPPQWPFRDLPDHLCWTEPPGSIIVNGLPLRDLDPKRASLKHVFDLVLDINPDTVDWGQIKAVVRGMSFPHWCSSRKGHPLTQLSNFLLLQSDGKACLLKHMYIVAEAPDRSIFPWQCGSPSKKLAASGTVRRMSDSSLCYQPCSDKVTSSSKPKAPEQDEEGWNFLMERGEIDNGGLKQLAGSMRRFMTKILQFMGGNGVLKVRAPEWGTAKA